MSSIPLKGKSSVTSVSSGGNRRLSVINEDGKIIKEKTYSKDSVTAEYSGYE